MTEELARSTVGRVERKRADRRRGLVRKGLVLVVALAVAAALWIWVFPWVDREFVNNPSIGL